jgi:hypothetical protein
MVFADLLKQLRRIARLTHHFEAGPLQQASNPLADQNVVVGNDPAAARCACSSALLLSRARVVMPTTSAGVGPAGTASERLPPNAAAAANRSSHPARGTRVAAGRQCPSQNRRSSSFIPADCSLPRLGGDRGECLLCPSTTAVLVGRTSWYRAYRPTGSDRSLVAVTTPVPSYESLLADQQSR